MQMVIVPSPSARLTVASSIWRAEQRREIGEAEPRAPPPSMSFHARNMLIQARELMRERHESFWAKAKPLSSLPKEAQTGGIGRAGSGRFGQVRAQLNPGRIGQVQPEPRPNLPDPDHDRRDFGQVQPPIPGSGRFGQTLHFW